MSELQTLAPTSSRRMSRAFHAAIVAALLAAVGFRVYGYFAAADSELASPDKRVVAADDPQLAAIAEKAFHQHDWQRAADSYGKIFEREPDNLEACWQWATSLSAAGQYDAALAAFLQCSRFDGEVRRWSLYNIACVYALKGEKRLALDYLSEAAEAGFRTPKSISDDPDLKSLLDDPEFQRLAELVKPIALRNVYRRFDFLVGHWKLIGEHGERVGRLDVEQVSAGYALRGEYVDDTRSTTRTLFAYYDPEVGNWHQLWLDEGGNIIHLQGVESDGPSFVLEGHLTTADGQRKPARATFEESENGVASILVALTPDSGVTWEEILNATLVARKGPKDLPPEDSNTELP